MIIIINVLIISIHASNCKNGRSFSGISRWAVYPTFASYELLLVFGVLRSPHLDTQVLGRNVALQETRRFGEKVCTLLRSVCPEHYSKLRAHAEAPPHRADLVARAGCKLQSLLRCSWRCGVNWNFWALRKCRAPAVRTSRPGAGRRLVCLLARGLDLLSAELGFGPGNVHRAHCAPSQRHGSQGGSGGGAAPSVS